MHAEPMASPPAARTRSQTARTKWTHGDAVLAATGLQRHLSREQHCHALQVAIFGLACMNLFYPYNRGGLYTALIMLYAATSSIAGYSSSSYYKQMEGTNWVRLVCTMFVTSAVGCLQYWCATRGCMPAAATYGQGGCMAGSEGS